MTISQLMEEPQAKPSEGQVPRVRLIIDTDDIIRRALARRASKRSLEDGHEITKSEAANEILLRELAPEISELERLDKRRRR